MRKRNSEGQVIYIRDDMNKYCSIHRESNLWIVCNIVSNQSPFQNAFSTIMHILSWPIDDIPQLPL